MNNIIKYDFRNNQIRIVEIEGEPWFVAKDVCDVLEIANHRNAIARLDDDEKGVAIMDTLGGKQEMTVVDESGLYELIWNSRKPEAKQFKRWVKREVLPTIRKTGSYGPQLSSEEIQTRKELTATHMIADFLRVNEASRIKMLDTVLNEMSCSAARKALPDYTEEMLTFSLTAGLKEYGVNMSARKMYPIMVQNGLVEVNKRASKTKGTKEFYSLTDKGLQFGKNLINPSNQKETQPHFFKERFGELLLFLNIAI